MCGRNGVIFKSRGGPRQLWIAGETAAEDDHQVDVLTYVVTNRDGVARGSDDSFADHLPHLRFADALAIQRKPPFHMCERRLNELSFGGAIERRHLLDSDLKHRRQCRPAARARYFLLRSLNNVSM